MATLSEIFARKMYGDLIMLPGFIDFPLEKVNL